MKFFSRQFFQESFIIFGASYNGIISINFNVITIKIIHLLSISAKLSVEYEHQISECTNIARNTCIFLVAKGSAFEGNFRKCTCTRKVVLV